MCYQKVLPFFMSITKCLDSVYADKVQLRLYSTCLLSSLFLLMSLKVETKANSLLKGEAGLFDFFFFFEVGSHVVHAGLEFILQLQITLNS